MYQAPQALLELNKSNVDAAMRVAAITLRSIEKLVGLQLGTAKEVLSDGASGARLLTEVKKPDDLKLLRERLVEPGIEKVQAYARNLYDVAAATQKEMSAVVESQIGDITKSMTAVLDQMAKTAPSGADLAVTAVRTAVSAANVAFDSLSRAAKQATEVGEASFAAVSRPARKKAA